MCLLFIFHDFIINLISVLFEKYFYNYLNRICILYIRTNEISNILSFNNSRYSLKYIELIIMIIVL